MNVRVFILCGMLVLAGCAQNRPVSEGPGPDALATGLTPQAERITDSRIAADMATMKALQQRIKALNESGAAVGHYPMAKAQCWLDTAWSQYHENDRTGYVEEALSESIKIVATLEKDKSAIVGFETPLVARSTRLREDLWSQINAHKSRRSTLACNARSVACSEVRLVRAGHAEQQTGWRQASPHVLMAEDALKRAAAEAASCKATG